MNCLNCDADLVARRRLKKDMSSFAYAYFHCPLCNKDFSLDNFEISKHGDTYVLKKDDTQPYN